MKIKDLKQAVFYLSNTAQKWPSIHYSSKRIRVVFAEDGTVTRWGRSNSWIRNYWSESPSGAYVQVHRYQEDGTPIPGTDYVNLTSIRGEWETARARELELEAAERAAETARQESLQVRRAQVNRLQAAGLEGRLYGKDFQIRPEVLLAWLESQGVSVAE